MRRGHKGRGDGDRARQLDRAIRRDVDRQAKDLKQGPLLLERRIWHVPNEPLAQRTEVSDGIPLPFVSLFQLLEPDLACLPLGTYSCQFLIHEPLCGLTPCQVAHQPSLLAI